MVTDFWSSKPQGTKFLELRVYLVDEEWNFRSVLLGTRHFDPRYGDRDGGIRRPFNRWIGKILDDFGLDESVFFGATRDAGTDVKWTMSHGLNLKWGWCIPYLTNAATQNVFRMVGQRSRCKNPEMTDLIGRIARTVYQVEHVEVMGDLYRVFGDGRTTQLLDYRSHHFMGLTSVIRRILDKWKEEHWYAARVEKARRHGFEPPSGHPLARDRGNLIQLLSLLEPITVVDRKSQWVTSNQVEVLLSLYRLRLTTLNIANPLKDYQSTLDRFCCRRSPTPGDRDANAAVCPVSQEVFLALHRPIDHQDLSILFLKCK